MIVRIDGRYPLEADAQASTDGATIRVRTPAKKRPVFFADIRLTLSQLKSLTLAIEEAIDQAGAAAGARSAGTEERAAWRTEDFEAATREADRLYALQDPGAVEGIHALIDRLSIDGSTAAQEIARLENLIGISLTN
jgi:hypothetical protein